MSKQIIRSESTYSTVRKNLSRDFNSWSDLLKLVKSHYVTYERMYNFLMPYNARQRNSGTKYLPPSKELLLENVKNAGMNDLSFNDFVNSAIKFCESTQGKRALPTPHPSVIHSVQLTKNAYSIDYDGKTQWLNLPGCEPVKMDYVKNTDQYHLIIVKPKLSKLGTASATNWEIVMHAQDKHYIIDHVDSNINPRYSGKF